MAGQGNCSESDILPHVSHVKNFAPEANKKTGKAPIPAESIEPPYIFIKIIFFCSSQHFLNAAESVQYSGPVGSIPAAAVAALGFLMVVTLGSCREASDAAQSCAELNS